MLLLGIFAGWRMALLCLAHLHYAHGHRGSWLQLRSVWYSRPERFLQRRLVYHRVYCDLVHRVGHAGRACIVARWHNDLTPIDGADTRKKRRGWQRAALRLISDMTKTFALRATRALARRSSSLSR